MIAPPARAFLHRRRASVAVLLWIMFPIIMGVAALTIDLGVIYNTRADLQRAADAAAFAAAAALSEATFAVDPLEVARQEAIKMAEANPVLGRRVTLRAQTDVIFGRGNYDPVTNTYNFVPSERLPDAVRIIVRQEEGSVNGPTGLLFAGVFGKSATDISASATAAIMPRDIVITADISGSLRFDSRLRDYLTKTVNNFDVWDALPGGGDEMGGTWAPDELPADPDQAAGPGWGYFKQLFYGDDPAMSGYVPPADPGLIHLRRSSTWNEPDLEGYLRDLGYNGAEINAIRKPYYESYYNNRVAVALGLVYWNSGIPGGLWEQRGVDADDAGNGNNAIGSGELEPLERIFNNSLNSSKNIWRDYTNYMRYHPTFRHRFGLKTFVDYLVEKRATPSQTPEFADTPLQPLQALKDAIGFMAELLTERETTDQMSLTTYSWDGIHRVDLSDNFLAVRDSLDSLMPYGATNMGEGLERAIDELTGSRVRPMMRQVIILITDGYANVGRNGQSSSSAGRRYALEEAQRAAELGIQIITISVGQDSDQALMEQIAQSAGGDHFHVEGSVQQYSEDLIAIFTQIGGRRSVDLIE